MPEPVAIARMPLSVALSGENLEVARDLILAGVEYDLADLAAIGDSVLVEQALKGGASVNELGARGDRALCAAAKRGHGKVVKILLDNGADPNGSETGAFRCIWRAAIQVCG